MSPIETAALRTLLWATTGAAAAIPVLVLPQPDDPLFTAVVQLAIIAVYAVAMTLHLAALGDAPWFDGLAIGGRARRGLTWVMLVADVAGASAVTALATSAALRYQPSVQLLQLVSVIVVGVVVSASALGTRRRWGGAPALAMAAVLGAVLVWVMWRHLDTVGSTASGGWRVDGSVVRETVVPYVAGAVVVAGALFGAGLSDRSD